MDDHIRLQDEDHRVAFDFEIEFSNGGGLKGWDFRLDTDGPEVSDEVLGDYIVRDLRLLMVGTVKISNKKVFKERHKRTAKPGLTGAVENGGNADKGRGLVDLSHAIHDGQITYPGLPAISIKDHLSHDAALGGYAEGVSFQIGRIDMVANSGTSIDAPYHRFPGTPDVAALPLASMADLQGVVVRLAGMAGKAVTRQALLPATEDVSGKAVLIETGWSARWGTPGCIRQAIPISRTTLHNICATAASHWSASTASISTTPAILRGQVTACCSRPASRSSKTSPIFTSSPIDGFRFSAVPMRAEGMGAFPVRAWARTAHRL